MEPRSQLFCGAGTNCIIHLHSAAGRFFLRRRRLYPFHHIFHPSDGHPVLFSRHVLQPLRFPLEIFSFFLTHMKNSIQILEDYVLTHIIIVLPTIINTPNIRYGFSITAGVLGIHIPLFLERSVAAASFYQPISPDSNTILVFEHSNHILEISLLTLTEDRRDLKVQCAVNGAGCPLFNEMLDKLSRLHNINIEANADALIRLNEACERAKDDLCSGAATALIQFEEQGKQANIPISRESLVNLNLNHLRSRIEACLDEARVGKESVDEIVLAGASICIPEVRGMIQDFFGEKPCRSDFDPVNLISISAMRFGIKMSAALTTRVFPVILLNFGVFLG